ncbi:MAG: hypothetical protein IPJ34_07860 [Myxococcales bacterium]|nr:hypothetical protein [Myxococcales bacterium]
MRSQGWIALGLFAASAVGCGYPSLEFGEPADGSTGDVALDASDTSADGVDGCVPNACGGCGPLTGIPGTACASSCGAGSWVCQTKDSVGCKPTTSGNACGGCGALSAKPGDACTSACGAGTWVCAGIDAVACKSSTGNNECGGCSALTGKVGDACGCGGKLACSGTDALVCSGSSSPNACGGCAKLTAPPGSRCGTCNDGTLICDRRPAGKCTGATPRGAGRPKCGAACVSTQEDPRNCGGCGTSCAAMEHCVAGACACRPGLVRCGGACVPSRGDAEHCGATGGGCGTVCTNLCMESSGCAPSFVTSCGAGELTCASSTGSGKSCLWAKKWPMHCGACGVACTVDQVCAEGSCQGYRVAVGCTTCPCATCGATEKCCPAPTGHTYAICVQGTQCPSLI